MGFQSPLSKMGSAPIKRTETEEQGSILPEAFCFVTCTPESGIAGFAGLPAEKLIGNSAISGLQRLATRFAMPKCLQTYHAVSGTWYYT